MQNGKGDTPRKVNIQKFLNNWQEINWKNKGGCDDKSRTDRQDSRRTDDVSSGDSHISCKSEPNKVL